jgi:hypothetical protein
LRVSLPPHVKKPAKTCGKTKETFNNNKGVCHNIVAIAIYITMYLKAKEELWKFKYFTMHAKKKKEKKEKKNLQKKFL